MLSLDALVCAVSGSRSTNIELAAAQQNILDRPDSREQAVHFLGFGKDIVRRHASNDIAVDDGTNGGGHIAQFSLEIGSRNLEKSPHLFRRREGFKPKGLGDHPVREFCDFGGKWADERTATQSGQPLE